jgi:hypothetical protein
MISRENFTRKTIKNLVDAAEKLAALQYRAGLHSGKPTEEKLKPKVNKAWQEFHLAADALTTTLVIKQENNIPIGLDTNPRRK